MVIFVWLRRRWPWLSLALNGVLAIVLARPLFRPNREMFGSQPKGDFDIVVFARHDGRVERLDRYNRWVHPGDGSYREFARSARCADGGAHLGLGSDRGRGPARG